VIQTISKENDQIFLLAFGRTMGTISQTLGTITNPNTMFQKNKVVVDSVLLLHVTICALPGISTILWSMWCRMVPSLQLTRGLHIQLWRL
jgi:hypothetical protein